MQQCVLSSLGLAFLFFMLADSVMLCCHIAFEGSLNMLVIMMEFELLCKSGFNILCPTNFSSRNVEETLLENMKISFAYSLTTTISALTRMELFKMISPTSS